MAIRGDNFPHAADRRRHPDVRRRGAGVALAVLATTALAGCSLPQGAGTILVDPGRYTGYHCNELIDQWKLLVTRERELHGLMDKAEAGGGSETGAIIGSVAYRPEYEAVLSNEKLLQRTATEKNCPFMTEFQSDRTIR